MSIKVSTIDKERFIKWLLSNYKFKALESERILTYLLVDNQLLNQTHFVNDVTNCPRAIILSTTTVTDEPLVFYKSNVKTLNGLQAYHDLRLNNDEPLFIKINLTDLYDQLYYAVLESNPFYVDNIIDRQDSWTSVNKTLDDNLRQQHKQYLQRQIDIALDKNDKDLFIRLSAELKKLASK